MPKARLWLFFYEKSCFFLTRLILQICINFYKHLLNNNKSAYVLSYPSGWKIGSQPKFLSPLGATIVPLNKKINFLQKTK